MNFYYGLVDEATNAWGFVEEVDPRVHKDMVFLTADEWQALLSGQSKGMPIVYYEGRVFNDTEPGRHYLDADGWHRKTDEIYYKELADQQKANLINYNYQAKADKAYGGVVINDSLVFETNQTSITNTVASLALMQDNQSANWKFYTKDGAPKVQKITKAQLSQVAVFGQKMINDCFELEGKYNDKIETASIEELNNPEFVENLKQEISTGMEAVNNGITVQF